jgi:hypothetical protein
MRQIWQGLCSPIVSRVTQAGCTWHLDEMFVTLHGEPYLLWPAVDEHIPNNPQPGSLHEANSQNSPKSVDRLLIVVTPAVVRSRSR